MTNHIIVCVNFEQHIIEPLSNIGEPPHPSVYISDLFSAKDLGWKREALKWYCPKCAKEQEGNNGQA